MDIDGVLDVAEFSPLEVATGGLVVDFSIISLITAVKSSFKGNSPPLQVDSNGICQVTFLDGDVDNGSCCDGNMGECLGASAGVNVGDGVAVGIDVGGTTLSLIDNW